MRIVESTIVLKPKPATIDTEFEALKRDVLALAASWLNVNVRGLPLDVARRVVRAEADRLKRSRK